MILWVTTTCCRHDLLIRERITTQYFPSQATEVADIGKRKWISISHWNGHHFATWFSIIIEWNDETNTHTYACSRIANDHYFSLGYINSKFFSAMFGVIFPFVSHFLLLFPFIFQFISLSSISFPVFFFRLFALFLHVLLVFYLSFFFPSAVIAVDHAKQTKNVLI